MPRRKKSAARKKRAKKSAFGWVRLCYGVLYVGLLVGAYYAGAYWGARRLEKRYMRALPNRLRAELDKYWQKHRQTAIKSANKAAPAAERPRVGDEERAQKKSLSSLVKDASSDEDLDRYHYTHAFDFTWPKYSVADRIAEHESYAVCYEPRALQARWVAYVMRTAPESAPNKTLFHNSKGRFALDPLLSDIAMPTKADYDEGYEMGALVLPEQRLDKAAHAQEVFYRSLVCPQTTDLGAAWQSLARLMRIWVAKESSIYVVSGPVLKQAPRMRMSRVRIPSHWFQALLVLNKEGAKAIGFLLPQTIDNSRSVMDYACSLNEIEKQTGLVLFPRLPASLAVSLKDHYDLSLWRN